MSDSQMITGDGVHGFREFGSDLGSEPGSA